MPATPNILIQNAAQAKAQAASAKTPAMAADTGDKASSFAKVFADQGPNKPVANADNSPKPARDKVADSSGKKDLGKDPSAAAQPAVADSGNDLPADKAAASDDTSADSDANSDAPQTPVVEAGPVDPALDPALVAATQPLIAAPVVQTPAVVATAQPEAETPALAALPGMVKDPAAAPASDFDPSADPLDSLPAVRMAMEQGGHISAASQAQPKASPAQTQADGELTAAQNFAAGMASMLDVQADKDSTSQGGEKAFSGLIDDGLKDLTSATSDTRVDDFANRLAALTQAATPKTANAVPVNQPIAMHQSGWTEEVVNRVMYLSSANLKAADIQLQPAELGRLDIRVNMVPDQQTQVTFMSAHPSVREALDSQMHRLRDMFNQQGMGQVDVNVADQNRGWQGQQGQEQAQQGQSGRTSAAGGRLDAVDEELPPASVAEVAAQTTSVIGSSAVDYYA
ncbi:flagellar hook-length control protein FliK [Pseudomonas granadensis]|uniref:flagellar hook-length control protein FliK n=1 Tax=Pseudomonas granadensis TaxID=1421430 RepID=UPI0019D0A0B9|nr:flagellar hook-length control protein FliK [Pseudomonas granadensis]MBN6773469.1 flagellar hook-length control protein FliK [Pseudomonas granadensis]MBN6804772.1 flagellar hook-length control protein FliK [Pseudomonas granadensis]MBN6831918.1 flagellar hook-length control protein FliK [Pseudomonas granadensis]MBN6838543.1 flagellar hook-length control protein FliK [Pseudomonas granadensis]MBN6866880.1 flagellar hook-length control protein FliK [Pseudomonas granadensis]